jgi:thiol-disulfide isomerase/thioredoxin
MVEVDKPIDTLRESRISEKSSRYHVAKELVRPSGFINIDSVKIADNIGKKVILVDFWTYSCINCQRTLPYLNEWHSKYSDDGLLIIGVHSPEFNFEKELANVQKAVDTHSIKYPVVLDNNKGTWSAYENRYWPRKYLIDIDGFIVYDHIGEGAYAETEKEIQKLLMERKEVLGTDDEVNLELSKPIVESADFSKIKTPEIYFGYKFSRNQIGNNEGFKPEKIMNYTLSSVRALNYFYLDGSWMNNEDHMELKSEEGKVTLKYTAKNVNMVAGSNEPTEIVILLDGDEIGKQTIEGQKLYNIVFGDDYSTHEIEIRAKSGFKIYTFTFG